MKRIEADWHFGPQMASRAAGFVIRKRLNAGALSKSPTGGFMFALSFARSLGWVHDESAPPPESLAAARSMVHHQDCARCVCPWLPAVSCVEDALGWQLCDAKDQPQGSAGSEASPGGGAAGIALADGVSVLFP